MNIQEIFYPCITTNFAKQIIGILAQRVGFEVMREKVQLHSALEDILDSVNITVNSSRTKTKQTGPLKYFGIEKNFKCECFI